MKLIVTSATMDAQKFAEFFGNVPTFQVSVVLFYFCFVIKYPGKSTCKLLSNPDTVLVVSKVSRKNS